MSTVLDRLAAEHGVFMNEQQRQAVCTDSARTLLLAVPGSGKTTVLTARIAYCIEERGVSPSRILTLTFSRETASDMQKRFVSLFPSFPAVRFSTIHSFCFSVLRRYASVYHRALPTLLAGENASLKYRILRDCTKKVTGEYPADDLIEEIEQQIGCVKNRMLSPEKAETEIESFPEIYEAYQTVCRMNRLMDFDDMLVLCYNIFTRCPDVLSHFKACYDMVCVDEAQDTSLLQHRILERLVEDGMALFMVGDEDQSIYSFRGASPDELLSFSKAYPDAQILKMETNYRSNCDIVQKADRFIAQNRARYEKHMVCENEREDSVLLIRLRDYSEQGKRIVQMLKETGGRTAILYKNNESAVTMIDLFLREGISYVCRERELSFFTSAVVEDVKAYLRLAADPCDTEAFSRLYYKLGCSRLIFEYTKANIADYSSVFDCAASFSSLQEYRRAQLLKYRDLFKQLLMMRPAEAVDVIRRELGLDRFIERRMTGFSKISAYQKLSAVSCIAAHLRRTVDLNARLAFLAQAMREGADSATGVLLSTIHSSKGMEFDTVFLIDMYDDVLPSCDAKEQKRTGDFTEYENEVRLFYVAATRAKTKLVLFRSDRLNGGSVAESPFLQQFCREEAEKSVVPPEDSRVFLPDTRVVHSVFGKGTVLFAADGFLTVRFDGAGCKRLSLSVCLERKMLALLLPE